VADVSLGAKGGSGNGAIQFSVVGSGCNIVGTHVHANFTTRCTVTAIKAASGDYAKAVSQARFVSFTLKSQAVLNLAVSISAGSQFVSQAANLKVTGGSGHGTISFAVTGSGCQVVGPSVVASQNGTCNVYALKSASGLYAQRKSATKSFHLLAGMSVPISYQTPEPYNFPTSDWGNLGSISDCTFAAAADWEELILGNAPDPYQIATEFGQAGGTDQGLTIGQLFTYWENHGIAGVRVKGYQELIPNQTNLEGSVYANKAVLGSLYFSADSTIDGIAVGAGGHMVLVDGYNATGPVVVSWGFSGWQMTWQEWNSEATGVWVVQQ